MTFKLTVPIEKCYTQKSTDHGGLEVEKKYIVGLASGTELDRDTEKMAESALHAMRQSVESGIITEKGELSDVPLYNEHRKETLEQLGWLTKAWLSKGVNEQGKEVSELWIEAELDEDNPKATTLYKKLTTPGPKNRPVQLGLSISGRVVSMSRAFDPELKKEIKIFDDIQLGEVSVVTRPSYGGSYLETLAKSYTGDLEETPIGETSMDMTKTEAQNETTSDVEKNETVQETGTTDAVLTQVDVDKAISAQIAPIHTQIGDLARLLEEMRAVLNTNNQSTETEKSTEETSEDKEVEKTEETTETDSLTILKQAINDTLSANVKPIMDKMVEMETKITALEAPVDKSFIVTGQGEDVTEASPLSIYETQKNAAIKEGRDFDPLKEALKLAFVKK